MNPTVAAFAGIYLKSSAAKKGGAKDYTIDWEKFLRAAGVHDGDEREVAMQDLLSAERRSDGCFVIDRNRRSGDCELIRLKREGGEEWLFGVTGLTSPAAERRRLADWFKGASKIGVPEIHADGWHMWCDDLESRAISGASVIPFKRDDEVGNAELLNTLIGVLNWSEESLIKRASSVIGGDSKLLSRLRSRLVFALTSITGGERSALADFGIFDAPRSAWVHGPLALKFSGHRLDLGQLAAPVSLSSVDLAGCDSLECGAKICLTVENECLFHELAAYRVGVLLIQTSFPGAATRLLIEKLPADMTFCHFGDSDPAGFAILRDLCERTGRQFKPLMMRFRSREGGPALTRIEIQEIERSLMSDRLGEECRRELREMLAAGTKGDFEQESLFLEEVLEEIRRL